MAKNSLFRYWGKADPNYTGEPKWHPLVYHCLDVAAVAAAWWDESPVIQRTFLASFDWPERVRGVGRERWHPQQQGKFEPDGHHILRVRIAMSGNW